MNNFFTVVMLMFLFSLTLSAQNFEVEWEEPDNLYSMGDLNGDGAHEFYRISNDGMSIYSCVSKDLLYTISDSKYYCNINPPKFKPYDLNSNGVKDIADWGDQGYRIIDPSTGEILYQFTNFYLADIFGPEDYDNDGILEVYISGKDSSCSSYFFKMISTGIKSDEN